MADQTQDIVNALKGLSPEDQTAMQPETFANPAVAQTMKGLAGIATIPKHLIDAAAEAPPPGLRREDFTDIPGSAQPGDKLISTAADTAMALAGTGAPAAETGAAGIFGGRLAQTADLRALKEAEKMRLGGKNPGDVRADTGWFRPPTDGQWRFEIPDDNMRLRFNPAGHNEGDSIIGDARRLVDHKDLYTAYPQLQNMPMESTKNSQLFNVGSNVPRAQGSYYPKNNGTPPHISVEGPNSPEITSTLAHELQHGVQDIEGFANGADPSHYSKLIMQGWKNKPSVLEGQPLANVLNEAYPLYRKTAGEVEARNTQNRLLWTPQQREMVHPWASQDTPYQNQVVYDPIAGTIKALSGK